MKIAYIDCFAGISGDTFLGAWVDAGLNFNVSDVVGYSPGWSSPEIQKVFQFVVTLVKGIKEGIS